MPSFDERIPVHSITFIEMMTTKGSPLNFLKRSMFAITGCTYSHRFALKNFSYFPNRDKRDTPPGKSPISNK
jgi:hypothetical protein